MRTSTRIWLGIFLLFLVCAVGGLVLFLGRGFSTRDEPSVLEAAVARRLRHLAVPRGAREMKNPVPATAEVLAEGLEHFADHCATCHGNDGRGDTPIGRKLYPKAPDMQLPRTHQLSDGELFYIIHNGVRFTGMPAWGDGTSQDDLDSWKLVHFIRHLQEITPQELERMKTLNPMTRAEFEQEEEIRRFLEGETAPLSEGQQEHQHKH